MSPLIFALLSGIPALVLQVAWTRRVALLAGSHVESISLVLVVFFGGLALGARLLGPRSDRAARPLRLYGALEVAAGALAIAGVPLLPRLGSAGLAAAGAVLLPVTFLLGGTLPALVVAAGGPLARAAGRVAGLNTAGSVLGVALAALAIPQLGLTRTLVAAGLGSLGVGIAALWVGGAARSGPPPRPPREAGRSARAGVLAAAALAGVATLAYEVLAARGAALLLGSTLLAWAWVLALFLAALALGNALAARRAAASASPATDLGLVETAAALLLVLGSEALLPELASPAAGLRASALGRVALAVFPPAFAMGAAFPLLVRLAARERDPGASFAGVSAANTAGGIAGALLAPFALLPTAGLAGGILACAALNAGLAGWFLAQGAPTRRGRWLRAAWAPAGVALAGAVLAGGLAPPDDRHDGARVLFVDHGRQATAVVVHHGGRRSLIVDGDYESSTGGSPRVTEEWLAVLPLLLHPQPRDLLEVGLGAGISLATAARFPLASAHCAEIAGSVLRAAPLFAPDNDPVAAALHDGAGAEGADGRVRLFHADGRLFLAAQPGAYDVVVANTLHPWSLGATGLYSRQYFERVRAALRPGGVAAQWLPLDRIGADSLRAILRTFYAVFGEGGVWWGHGALIALGSEAPLAPPDPERVEARLAAARIDRERLVLPSARGLAGRRLADAQAVRAVVGPGELLSDDRPRLELRAALRRAGAASEPALSLAVALARAGAQRDPAVGPLLLWLESLEARARGESERADGLESLAERAGLALARDARLERRLLAARRAFVAGELDEGRRIFADVLGEAPGRPQARYGLAAIAFARGEHATAGRELARLLADDPGHAEGWKLRALLHARAGDAEAASAAYARSLRADPFDPETLLGAGLAALRLGRPERAREMLERLEATAPLGPSREARALREAFAGRAAAP